MIENYQSIRANSLIRAISFATETDYGSAVVIERFASLFEKKKEKKARAIYWRLCERSQTSERTYGPLYARDISGTWF